MNSVRILAVLLIILGLVIAGQRIANQSNKNTEKATASPSSTPTDSPSVTPTSSPTNNPPTPTSTSIPTDSPSPTNAPANQSLNISDLKYPGATIINESESKLELESSDDPQKITDWFKDKIKSKNLNVTSFVQTSTNGNVLNKLVGANSNTELRVEITKQNDSQTVKISISLVS